MRYVRGDDNGGRMRLEGVFTALVTPFADDEVDFGALDGLVDFQLAAGIDGLVLCGTTAEAPTLSELEQARIIDHVVQRVSGRCPRRPTVSRLSMAMVLLSG